VASADTIIQNNAVTAAPKDVPIAGGQEISPLAVRAHIDGSGAGTAWLPALQLVTPGGAVAWTAVADSTVAAGASADMSWFPRVGRKVSGGYTTVQDEGAALPQQPTLDFAGAGVTATDDAANSRTLVTIPGGGGGGGFTIGARVYNSVDQSIPTGVNTTLAFDSERFDTDNIHSNTVFPERLTCRTAGKYLIWAQVYYDTNSSGFRFLGIYNSVLTGYIVLQYTIASVGLPGPALNVSTVYELAINDYVECRVQHNAGVALNAHAGMNYSPEFGMQRVG
jgi:hypothetical protein